MPIEMGVGVIERTDYNYQDVVYAVAKMVCDFAAKKSGEVKEMTNRVRSLVQKALWSSFIKYYDTAYDIALRKRNKRIKIEK